MHRAVGTVHPNHECLAFFLLAIRNMKNSTQKITQLHSDSTGSDPEKDFWF